MLQNTIYAKRSAKDFVIERQMELCRGFRFEEMLSLTFYESDSLLEMGHLSGILYLWNLVAELPADVLKSIESPTTDALTQNVFHQEFARGALRNVLVLHEPLVYSAKLPADAVLGELQNFVSFYYGQLVGAIYSPAEEPACAYTASGDMVCYPGRRTGNNLLCYEYGMD